jgi:hypothetical protein
MPTTVRAAAEMPAWETTDTLDGIWRFNAALRYVRDARSYPYALDVFVPVARVGPPRRHHGASTEEQVTEVVAGRAVLAGVLTSRDGQRFVFYTDSPDWTAKLQGQLRAATGSGTLRVYCDPDAGWHRFRSQRRRREDSLKPIVLGLLSPTSIVPWVMVKDAYGPAWGWGELVVLGILAVAFLLPHTYVPWFSQHPAPIRGARAVALSAALLFPLLALTRVPAWIALITSLLAGAALVAGVRAARSNTSRALAGLGRRSL